MFLDRMYELDFVNVHFENVAYLVLLPDDCCKIRQDALSRVAKSNVALDQ